MYTVIRFSPEELATKLIDNRIALAEEKVAESFESEGYTVQHVELMDDNYFSIRVNSLWYKFQAEQGNFWTWIDRGVTVYPLVQRNRGRYVTLYSVD